jgi:hypothetical protein
MKRLENGSFVARLQVSEEVARFAARAAKQGGYFGARDYLNAILNAAMLAEMERESLSPHAHEESSDRAQGNEHSLRE